VAYARAFARLHKRRCEQSRILYGEQAMFVRPALLWVLDGFPASPIREDVRFSEKLVRATRPVLLDEHAATDSRKFLKMGVLLSLVMVIVIMLCYALRLRISVRTVFNGVR
jgi:hypothetical protein